MDWWVYLVTIGIFAAPIAFLWCINLPRRLRYRQVLPPIAALMTAAAVLILHRFFFGLLEDLPALVSGLPAQWSIPISGPAGYIIGNGYLLLNLIILLLFFCIKLCLQTLILVQIGLQRMLTWLRRRFGAIDNGHRLFAPGRPKARFAYENRAAGISLKNTWAFPAVYMRWCSLPAMALLLGTIVLLLNSGAGPLPGYLPRLPALSLLILMEIAWYLGGPRLKDLDGDFSYDETSSRMVGSCSDLMEKYHDLWQGQILSSAVLDPGRAPLGSGKELIVQDAELEQIKKNLSRLGTNLYMRQVEVLRQLWAGRDLLLASYRLEEIAPCLFAGLQRNLEEGCRIVFLVDTRRRSEHLHDEVRQWISRWMIQPIFAGRSCRITSIDQFQRNEEILIASVGELLDLGINNFKEWFGRVRTIVVLNVPEVIFPDILSANALFQIISDQSAHPIQKIMLTADKRKNMEDAARGYLTAKPVESDFFDGMMPTREACYTIWRSEGRQPYQQRLDLGGESDIGVEMALATPSLKDGIRPIHLAGMAHLPWKEYLESLDNMQFRIGMSVNLKETLCYHARPYLQQKQDRTFCIVRDDSHNLLVTLQRFLALGDRGAFVHVVCPPYLLRGYFVDNMDFFMGTEPLRALAPLLTHNPATILYYLLERMVATSLTEEQIRHHLEWGLEEGANRNAAVETLLEDLFEEVFELSLRQTGFLKTQSQWRFQSQTCEFEKIVTYHLSPEIKQHLKSFTGDYYRIYYEKERVVDTILENHIFQKYLPDQTHAFMGQPAEIKKISTHRRSIYTEHRSPEGNVIYKPVDVVQIHQAKPSFELPEAAKGSYSLTRRIYEADLSIRTEGFFTFRVGIDLDSIIDYKTLDRHESPCRRHSHGRVLVFEVDKIHDDKKIDGAADLSNTLALLMNELLVTLFPETHPYIKISTPHKRTKDDGRVGEFIPRLVAGEDNAVGDSLPFNTDGVCLYVFEDSQKDMGLVRSVKENLIYIFEIMEDYLFWHMQCEDNEKSYLNFGIQKRPQWLTIEPAYELLHSLLEGYPNTLRKRRLYFAEGDKGLPMNSLSKRVCDFCGEPLSGSMHEQMQDGRERCHMCRDNAVHGAEGYEQLLNQGRRWLLETYKADISKNIRVKVTGTKIIHDIIEETFVPTSSFDPRAVGLAVSDRDGYAVFVENNHRFDLTLATFVHELTHIWQYENLNYAKMKRDYGLLLIEGQAVYAAIECMQSKGLARIYCEKEPLRDDEYGKGYRLIRKLLEEHNRENPFSMLKEMYSIK